MPIRYEDLLEKDLSNNALKNFNLDFPKNESVDEKVVLDWLTKTLNINNGFQLGILFEFYSKFTEVLQLALANHLVPFENIDDSGRSIFMRALSSFDLLFEYIWQNSKKGVLECSWPKYNPVIYNSKEELVNFIFNHRDQDNFRLIHVASYEADAPLFQKILRFYQRDHRISVETTGREGVNPLMRAILAKKAENVRILVKEHPALVEMRDHDGNRALYYATVISKSAEITKILVDAGADVKAFNNNKDSVLHLAVQKDSPLDVLRELVKTKNELDFKNGSGKTVESLIHLNSDAGNNKQCEYLKSII